MAEHLSVLQDLLGPYMLSFAARPETLRPWRVVGPDVLSTQHHIPFLVISLEQVLQQVEANIQSLPR